MVDSGRLPLLLLFHYLRGEDGNRALIVKIIIVIIKVKREMQSCCISRFTGVVVYGRVEKRIDSLVESVRNGSSTQSYRFERAHKCFLFELFRGRWIYFPLHRHALRSTVLRFCYHNAQVTADRCVERVFLKSVPATACAERTVVVTFYVCNKCSRLYYVGGVLSGWWLLGSHYLPPPPPE